jgi:hypothetical protein
MEERVVDADSSVVLVQFLSKATVVRVVDHAVVTETCSLRFASCPRRELNVAHRIRRYRRLKFLDLSDVTFRRRLQKFVVLDDPSETPVSIQKTADNGKYSRQFLIGMNDNMLQTRLISSTTRGVP